MKQREKRLYPASGSILVLEKRRVEGDLVHAIVFQSANRVVEVPVSTWEFLPTPDHIEQIQLVAKQFEDLVSREILQYPWRFCAGEDLEHEFIRLACLREGVGYVRLNVRLARTGQPWYDAVPPLAKGMMPMFPAAVAALLEMRYREALEATKTDDGSAELP